MVKKIGRYEIRKELGRGGMATVFQGFDPRMKRDVAIKVLPREFLHDPKFLGRFEREAQTIASLEHAAIVPIYDFGDDDGQPYIVMRYMSGGSLADRIGSEIYSLEGAGVILSRIAGALDKAHQRGVVHRDLKPGNILFDESDDAFLADFGIVKLTEATAVLTGTGSIIGTPAYMSPEQAEGKDLDGRSDVYSLGVILFELLSGKKPFYADTPVSLLVAHVSKPIPDIRDINTDLPPGMTAVLQKALAKDRDDRYQTAAELAQALGAQEALPAKKRVSKPKTKKPEPKKRKEATKKLDPQIEQPTMDTPPPLKTKKPKAKRKRGLVWVWVVVGAGAIFGLYSLYGGGIGIPATEVTETPVNTVEPEPTRTEESTLIPATVLPIGSTRTNESEGAEMAYVPAGEFEMGSEDGNEDENPVHTVFLDAFWIYKYEVTNGEYRQCVEEGACNLPSKTDDYGDQDYNDHPVTFVSWDNADTFCKWAGGRLPTEAEWEKAARGTDHRTYPWGEEIDATYANYGFNVGDTTPVGSYPKGVSIYGVMDMAGNVWEWVGDMYGNWYYGESPLENPEGPESGENRVLRGGSWSNGTGSVRVSLRSFVGPRAVGSANDKTGFRCVALLP